MKKNQNTKYIAMGPFRDSQAPSWDSGNRTDVPTEPPSHIPCPHKAIKIG